MSLDKCIPGLVADGKLSQEKGDEMLSLYGELKQNLQRQFGDQAASAMATDATLKAMERANLLKKRQALLQVQAQKSALMAMDGFDGGRAPGGPIDPRAGVALFDRDGRASYSNVEGRRKAIRGRAHAMIDGILADHSRNVLGEIRHRAQLEDIVREAFGENTGNLSAKELADAWARTAEMLRARFNAAGGDIGKIERWGMPQAHDSVKVRRAGYQAWRDAIAPLLDRAQMIDRRTEQPFTDEALELALRDVWEGIRTEGWDARSPAARGAGKMANRHGDSRFLVFRSADDWMSYQKQFGAGTAFDAMMGHIDGMSREIAMMEILGPSPNATVDWIKGAIEKTAALDTSPDTKAIDRANAGVKQIDRLWNELNGANNRPENRRLALGFSALRSFQTAAKLGSAALSAVTDVAFQWSTRHFNGLPQASMIRDYVKLMRPGAVADQRLAVRLGLIAEEWSQMARAQGRYLGEELTGEVSRRLAEGVLRLSGLQRWTQAGRWAFGMEFLGHLTDEAGKSFDSLHPALRASMERAGIGADGWDAIRATPLETDRGVAWLKPQNIKNRELGDRLLEMILTETDFAVPTPDLRTRALMNSIAPKGTWAGEIVRSALLFKSFGISMTLQQSRRIMEQSASNAAKYAAGLVIGTTLMGGLALQLKAIAGGKDPRPMEDAPFWGAAMLQGGGFGIFGDFLNSTQNRFGGGFAQTLAGPLVQDAQSIADVAKAKHPAWSAAKLVRQELPGGSIWYAKLAFDRLVTDQIQEEIDPSYRQSWRRLQKRAREQRTDFYWAPGETAPDRAPDLANIAPGETLQ